MTDITVADLELRITSGDGTYAIALPEGECQILAYNALEFTRSVEMPDEAMPARELERSGDVFDDLEKEMANDTVQQSIGLHFDMQDMVATRLLTNLVNDMHVGEVSADDLFELGLWFNRRRYVFKQLSSDNGSHELLATLCGIWSEQLLDEAV